MTEPTSSGGPGGETDGSTTITTPSCATPPQGSWKTASAADTTTAGFATLTLNADGTYTQTGRTDGEPMAGKWTQPSTITIDPDFGNPPAGMHGPYIDLDNSTDVGDGEWDYGWVEASDCSTLTLTEYAQRYGMGLRWATTVTTVTLVSN